MSRKLITYFAVVLLLCNTLLLLSSLSPVISVTSAESDIETSFGKSAEAGSLGEDLDIINPAPAAPVSILGYHNLSEVEAKLFSIAQTHPNIAKTFDLSELYPHPNGSPKRTFRNRSVYAIKISDNPGINESSEPDILYMGLHHAREWITVEMMLFLLDYLINNYKTNTTIGKIINTTELWLVPVVNPDGLYHSQNVRDDINNSNWNQWRKNCNETNGYPGFQDNDSASGDGVDLNRNYGYQWGYDNSGSSPNKDSLLYRGSAPFSEVETQLIRDLALARQFKLAITYHSYSDVILFPYAYDDYDTAHDALFNEIAKDMAQYNNYVYGNPKDGVLYNCNGEACDWLYANRSCLAFTFELYHNRYIPPPAQILPICQKNLEPALLIAKLGDDPYKIFKSGIRGRVTTTQGVPLVGVNVSTNYATDAIWNITNNTGHYQLRLPAGTFGLHGQKDGYWLRSVNNIIVQEDKYTTKNFTMIDSEPPVISAVWADIEGKIDNTFKTESIVRINVAELFNEAHLTGTVQITSIASGYDSGERALQFNETSGYYHVLWNTSSLLPADDYVVEATLKDQDINMDANGSNDTGPDLILKIIDKTAPIVSRVDTKALGPWVDSDEHYEVGTSIQVIVNEQKDEKWLSGTVNINSPTASYASGQQTLKFDPVENLYYWNWSTEDLIPANDYYIETTLSDKWNNIDSDGLVATPDLTVTLVDTTPPKITRVDSSVGTDDDEVYEQGAQVKIVLEVLVYEPGLAGFVNISSAYQGYEKSITDLKYDAGNEQFYVFWDTNGLQVAIDYVVETELADIYFNYDTDGSNALGPDLTIILVDTTPPVVSGVYSFVGNDNDNQYELDSEVWFVVIEAQRELNLTGTIQIHSTISHYDSTTQELSYDDTLEGYVWVWNTDHHSISVANDFEIEVTLADEYNNKDLDGLPEHPDLTIALEDTTPPEITAVWATVGIEANNEFESGSVVKIVIEERYAEPNLIGTIHIASLKTGYDSSIQDLTWDKINGYYTFIWPTEQIPLSDDYAIETSLTDRWLNSDSDGLPQTPDVLLTLVDTTPPDPISGLVAVQSPDELVQINLTWASPEANSTIHIYRSNETIHNLTDLEFIIKVTESNYTDTLPTVPGTYYYLALVEDTAGNINFEITESNTVSVTLPEPPVVETQIDIDRDSSAQPWLWVLVAVVIVIIVIIVVSYFLRRKGRGKEENTAYF